MRKLLLGILVSASVLMAGCEPPKVVGGVVRSPKETYKAVVSLSPSTTEVVAITGTKLMGRTSACNYPEYQAKSTPIVGGVKPDYEALARLKPDLIVLDTDLYTEQDLEKLKKEIGAELFEFNAESVADYEKQMLLLGSKLGVETAMSENVDKVHRAVEKSISDQPSPKPKVAVIMAGSTGNHMIMGTKGFFADVYRIAGADLIGPESKKFEALKPEFLISMNPDIIFVPGKVDEFLKDTRFSALKAVKDGKVYGLEPDIALRKGSRVQTLVENLSNAMNLKK